MKARKVVRKLGVIGGLLILAGLLLATYAIPAASAYITGYSNWGCSSKAVGTGCTLNESCSPTICIWMKTQVDSVTPSNEGMCAGYDISGTVTCTAFCGTGAGSEYYYTGSGTVASAYLNVGSHYLSCTASTANYNQTDTIYSNG